MKTGSVPVTAAAAALLGLLALGTAPSCGGGGDDDLEPGTISLLRRTPDFVVDQPGVLEPTDDRTFGDFGLDGWMGDGEDVATPRTVAWSSILNPQLRLPSIGTGNEVLRLDAQAPPGAELPVTVSVKLNDQVLGTVALGAELETHEVAVPVGAWIRGGNILELKADKMTEIARNRSWSLGLARVDYAKVRDCERTGDGWSLASESSLQFTIEPLGKTMLEIAGTTASEGRLDILFQALSGTDGSTRDLTDKRSVETTDGVLRVRSALPPSAGATLQIELRWYGKTPDVTFELETAKLYELEQPERPPIVFVSIDTLAAQNLSEYGYGRETTPHLSAILEDSILFENGRANAPWTVPSYMSQFTGLYPRAHLLEIDPDRRGKSTPWEQERIASNRWTLAEFLRAAGYSTAGWVDNPWLAKGFGFKQGFEHYDVSAAEIGLEDPDGGFQHIVDRAMDWLDDQPASDPKFLFLQAFDPHAPYHVQAPWDAAFEGDGVVENEDIRVGMQEPFGFGVAPSHLIWGYFEKPPFPETVETELFTTLYDQKILEMDAAFGELVDGLKKRGLYDDALIIFSADHGESTGAHNFYYNHALLYNDAIHVPLVVKLPGNEQGGRRISDAVQLVDLVPTVQEMIRPDVDGRLWHGRSLLPLLRGEELPDAPIFAEGRLMAAVSIEFQGWKVIRTIPVQSSYDTQLSHRLLDRERLGEIEPRLASGFPGMQAVTDILAENPEAKRFLTESLDRNVFEVYYLPDDPFEEHDLAAEKPEVITEAIELMRQLKQLGDHAQGLASDTTRSSVMTEADIAELRALGYTGDDG